ncbi:MAG TPA: hypothetical protein VM555_02310, partial [Tahibacter sp.]|nr:hypothetical protein [Tahibacter sp.]
MNVRKLMGRLNATTVKFDTGRGGVPELTNQDIAAAVGLCRYFIKDPKEADLAPAVFWWLYGPEGAPASNSQDARRLVLNEVYREFEARYQAAAVARLAVHNLEFDAPETRRTQPDYERELERARAALRQVHASCWPARDMSVYRRIVDTVALEFRSPRKCPACDGRMFVMTGDVRHTCMRCNGIGQVGLQSTWRAEHLKIDVERFKKTWQVVYEWVLN